MSKKEVWEIPFDEIEGTLVKENPYKDYKYHYDY